MARRRRCRQRHDVPAVHTQWRSPTLKAHRIHNQNPLPQANLIHLGIAAGISPWVYGLVAVTTRTGGYMAKRRSVRWTSWRPAAPDEQVPVGWIVGMPRLHAIEPTQHRGGPQAKEPDQGRQQPQPLGAGQLPSPGRRQPNRGRGPAGGHPDLVVGKGQPAQAELHEGRQDTAASLPVREHPGDDRVVLEANASAWASRGASARVALRTDDPVAIACVPRPRPTGPL
jgi:hypothetical protein